MDAPIFSSSSMTRMWFFLQAMCKGVKPFCSPTQRETDEQGLTREPREHPDHLADEKAALGPAHQQFPQTRRGRRHTPCTMHSSEHVCTSFRFFLKKNLVVFLDELKEPAV